MGQLLNKQNRKYNLLFCPYYSLWSRVCRPCGIGPNSICLFLHSYGSWAILSMGLFYTLFSPPPIAPQIFTLVKERDLTEIVEKYISPFYPTKRNGVGSSTVGLLTRKNIIQSIITKFGWEQFIRLTVPCSA